MINGLETKWRYNKEHDPYVKNGKAFSFYGNKKIDNRAVVWLRPFAKPPESPDSEYPLWLCTGRVLEHWHSGSMTRRVKELHQAMPSSYVEMHPEDARLLGISSGKNVKIITRRGEVKLKVSVNERGDSMKGLVFVPFFDESILINNTTLDAHCPLSKQPDYKKCACRLEVA